VRYYHQGARHYNPLHVPDWWVVTATVLVDGQWALQYLPPTSIVC
jgi:hypothetical protein